MTSNTDSAHMLQVVAGSAVHFLQPAMTSNTGSIFMLQGVAGGAAHFFATNYLFISTDVLIFLHHSN